MLCLQSAHPGPDSSDVHPDFPAHLYTADTTLQYHYYQYNINGLHPTSATDQQVAKTGLSLQNKTNILYVQ